MDRAGLREYLDAVKTTMNTQHTPTPFALPLEIHETREGPSIHDSQGERIAEAYTERGAIAIVRACNSHAQLVAFAERMARYFDENPNGYDDMRQQARAALSAAKE